MPFTALMGEVIQARKINAGKEYQIIGSRRGIHQAQ
jgi:hypothetical protein